MTAILAMTGATIFAFSLGAFVGWNMRRNHELKLDSEYWKQGYRDHQFRTWLNGKEYP